MHWLCLLSATALQLSYALPLNSPAGSPGPNVFVKQVVAVESVVVDAHGNRVKVTSDVVDLETLRASNNDMSAALAATKAKQQQALLAESGNVPATVDTAGARIPEGVSEGMRRALHYAQTFGLAHYVEVSAGGSGGLKSALRGWVSSIPLAEFNAVSKEALDGDSAKRSLSSPSSSSSSLAIKSIDFLRLTESVADKMAALMAAYGRLSDRACVVLEGCTGEECGGEISRVLKAANWIESRYDTTFLFTRHSLSETRSLLQQVLDTIFEGLLAPQDKRYATMRRAAELAMARGARVLVETGTARNGRANCGGDGCSTIVWARLLEHMAAISPSTAPILFTVDILPQAVKEAKAAASAYSPRISYHAMDSLKFLDAFGQPIDLLYLDSYDFDGSNPQPSQQHHLKELLLAWDKLHAGTVVIVDDCGLSNMGKCRLVDAHLMYAGWKLDTDGYQRVYVKQ